SSASLLAYGHYFLRWMFGTSLQGSTSGAYLRPDLCMLVSRMCIPTGIWPLLSVSDVWKQAARELRNHCHLLWSKINHATQQYIKEEQSMISEALHNSKEKAIIASELINKIAKTLFYGKGPLKRDIGERIYIVERIVPLFKAIQLVYNEYKFHWNEVELDCMREVKKIFPKFDLHINQADGLGVRNSSNKAVIFIEVSGGPEELLLRTLSYLIDRFISQYHWIIN
ncbi:4350_t:CDS:2, partial [Ambispora leptoticha]